MAVDMHKLIAAINPDVYCKSEKIKEVKEAVKDEGFLKASEKAELVDYTFVDLADTGDKSIVSAPWIKSPIERHVLVWDTIAESFEPLYFWMLDKMSEEFKSVDKLVDNFVSSPGSTHFTEMTQKAKQMQDEGMKMMGAMNQVLKSMLNLIYDLKEFEMRLEPYSIYKSKDKEEKEGALLSLKQIWMDTVDIKRGQGSINALTAGNLQMVTLRDAFMAAENVKLQSKGKEIELNERVKRILQQRISEFFIWVDKSEEELRKRYEIERNYLKSQYSTVQLYAKWAKPYLRAARALEQNMAPNAAITTAFNMALFELTLFGKKDYSPEEDIARGELPKSFKSVKTRKYSAVTIFEVKFRSMPERTQQGGVNFRVKAEVTLTSYGLNDDEIKVFRKEVDKDDINDTIRLIEGATTESLDQIQNDIKHFIDGDKKEDEKESKADEDINPFSALFSFFKSDKKKEQKDDKKEDKEIKDITKDSDYEKVLRSQAIIDARKKCYRIYDVFKKTRKMGSLPGYG